MTYTAVELAKYVQKLAKQIAYDDHLRKHDANEETRHQIKISTYINK